MTERLRIAAAAGTAALGAPQIRLMRIAGLASVLVAATLVALKLWAWSATQSVALLGSLADSLLDLLASLLTFVAVRYAVEPPDREHRFGHGKLEAVAGIVQALLVTASALYVAGQALLKLAEPVRIDEPEVGAAVMAVSIVLTSALVGVQRFVVRRTGSLAVKADSTHYMADLLTNFAVLGAIFLNYSLGWYLADPLLGLLIVLVVLNSVRRIAMEALDVLLDREMPDEVRAEIRDIAARHPSVIGVHDIRTRSAGATQFIQFHLELEGNLSLRDAHAISDDVERAVRGAYPRAEVLIHADPSGAGGDTPRRGG